MTGCWIDLGRVSYEPCVEIQLQVLEEVQQGDRENTLLFVEHPPVLTLGANFHEENLLLAEEDYLARGIEVARTDRGGDVTYHGPGQLVIYPIFRISDFGRDLHKWMRSLEETILVAIRSFGVEGYRFPPHTGVWVEDQKIAAIGIKVRKWVSMHGIALNCSNDLGPFRTIVPCGIEGYGVTSLSERLGRRVEPLEAHAAVVKSFESVFDIELHEANASRRG